MTAAAYGRFYDGVYRPLVSAFHGRLIDAQHDSGRAARVRRRPRRVHPPVHRRRRADDDARHRRIDRRRRQPLRAEFGLDRHADRSGAARGGAGARASVSRRSPGWSRSTTSATAASTRASSARRSITCSTSPARCGACASCCTDDGCLFIDIVDFRAAYLRNWSVEDATKIDHPYYLTQDTMTAYLRRAGFEIVRVRLRGRSPARQLPVPAGRSRRRDALPDAASRRRAASRDPVRAERAATAVTTACRCLVLAIVPARGGSKGVPARTSGRWRAARCSTTRRAAARASGVIDRIVLTTDSEEIADAGTRARDSRCRSCGPPRSPQDDTPMLPVIQHARRGAGRGAAGRRTSSCCCSRRRRCGARRTCATP